jgi:hypothetical protein
MKFYTFSGPVEFPGGHISITDIAVSLCRESRYAGNSLYWWPVALHSFVVADLLPRPYKAYGLLHDAEECVIGDIPKPAKTFDIEQLGHDIRADIWKGLGLDTLWPQDANVIHEADRRALHGEVWTVGNMHLRDLYPHDREVEELVWKYFKMYKPEDCIYSWGKAVMDFLDRFEEYKEWV